MNNEARKDRITVIEEPLPDGEISQALEGLLAAYNSLGFEQGYARANQYLLAMLPLLIEQFDREYVGVTPRDREVLKLFGQFLQEKLGMSDPLPA
jgi:hypothetical protein